MEKMCHLKKKGASLRSARFVLAPHLFLGARGWVRLEAKKKVKYFFKSTKVLFVVFVLALGGPS